MADLASSIAQAKTAGYSDGEIATYLAQDKTLGPQIAQARKVGYGDGEIVAHLAQPAPAPKVNTAADVAKSGLSGAAQGVLSVADVPTNFIPGAGTAVKVGTAIANMANRALHLQPLFADPSPQSIVDSAHAPSLARPSSNAFSDAVSPGLYQPKTVAGQYARTVGQFAPAAAAPGSIATRAANVLAPAIASETAGQVAHAMGASPQVEQGVRTAGAVLGGVGASVRVNPAGLARPKVAPAPSLDELTAAKDATYGAVDASGVRYKPEAFSQLADDMTSTMAAKNFNPKLHPAAAAMIDHIHDLANQAAGHSPSLTELDQLRQVIGRDVSSSSSAGDRAMGQIMRGKIDGFIASAGPEQMTGDLSGNAAQLITSARDLNTRVAKLRTLDGLDEAAADRAGATGTGTNGENTLRQNVIRFQKAINNLTPDEQAAVTKTIRGTPLGNVLRAIGSLSPEGGTVRAAASVATGALTHGVAPAAGFISRRVSEAITQGNVKALRDLIARGGSKADIIAARQALIAARPPVARLRNPVAPDQSVGNMFSAARNPLAR